MQEWKMQEQIAGGICRKGKYDTVAMNRVRTTSHFLVTPISLLVGV